MRRRAVLAGAAASLARVNIGRAATTSLLRFVPVIDLSFTDPVFNTSQVTRNHAFMVFDTLYGMSTDLSVSPQMVEGDVTASDGKQWDLRLRDGLLFHDGAPVLARDCVASIRRWGARDAMGAALLAATDALSAPDDRTIRFQLKRPFPMLPYALGKVAVNMCPMMPERLAATDPFKQVPEMVGSGPFRFKADERVPGARNVYERFAGYKPRETGVASWTAGPKLVHFDRVEWLTMPDMNTGANALQAGEVDWLEIAPHDLVPQLQRNAAIRTRILDPLGYCCAMRVNHLQPPFNNPALRRAVLGAIDQSAFMDAVVGTEPSYQHTPLGYFPPGSPMASDAGLAPFVGARDYDAVKRAVQASGYAGEKVVLLVPANSLAQKPLGDVAADVLRKAGLNVEYAAMEFGAVQQRQLLKTPVEQGGWSASVGNPQGMDWANPIGNAGLRAVGEAGYPGWYRSEAMEGLKADWLGAQLAEQKRIARDIQVLAMHDVPYYPIGQYLQPTAYRSRLEGIMDGTAVFWGVKAV